MQGQCCKAPTPCLYLDEQYNCTVEESAADLQADPQIDLDAQMMQLIPG